MEMLTPIGKKRLAAWVVMLFIGMLVACFAPQRVSAQELSLDDVTIQSFKIIDTTHGDAEIEYSLSSDASPKTDLLSAMRFVRITKSRHLSLRRRWLIIVATLYKTETH